MFSLMFPWPMAVLPCSKVGPRVSQHRRAWAAADFATRLLDVMRITGWTNLQDLALDVGLKAEPVAELLEGRSLIWTRTADEWTSALRERAERLGLQAAVDAIDAFGTTQTKAPRRVGRSTRPSAPPPDRLLWFRWNEIHRWPSLPRTRAGEWAMFYNPVLAAQMVAEYSIHTGTDPECMCDVLAAQPEGMAYRTQGSGGFKFSGLPRQWRSQQDFLDAWQMPPTAWSRRTVIRKASRHPADVAEHYIRARIDSRRSSARGRCC